MDTEIRRTVEKILKDKTAMRRMAQEAVSEGTDRLRSRIKRSEAIDNIIEEVIPRRYSSRRRSKTRRLIKEYLNEHNQI